MDEFLTTLCLKQLPLIPRRATVSVKLFLNMPQQISEIEQIGMQLMTIIHNQPVSRFIRASAPFVTRHRAEQNSRTSCNDMINNALNGNWPLRGVAT